MRIRILRDCDWDVTPSRTLAFKANTTDDRPRAIAEALIARGDAEAIPTPKPEKEA